MSPTALIAAIDGVIAELRASRLEDPTRVDDLLARARDAAERASLPERQELIGALARLEAEVVASLERIAGELRKTGAARTAMSGYGVIRPHTVGQHLRRRI